MIKIKAMNQIENLTFVHKPLENMVQMSSDWGVLYDFGKIFLRNIKYCLSILKTDLI
jgi:hypothetical protein